MCAGALDVVTSVCRFVESSVAGRGAWRSPTICSSSGIRFAAVRSGVERERPGKSIVGIVSAVPRRFEIVIRE